MSPRRGPPSPSVQRGGRSGPPGPPPSSGARAPPPGETLPSIINMITNLFKRLLKSRQKFSCWLSKRLVPLGIMATNWAPLKPLNAVMLWCTEGFRECPQLGTDDCRVTPVSRTAVSLMVVIFFFHTYRWHSPLGPWWLSGCFTDIRLFFLFLHIYSTIFLTVIKYIIHLYFIQLYIFNCKKTIGQLIQFSSIKFIRLRTKKLFSVNWNRISVYSTTLKV